MRENIAFLGSGRNVPGKNVPGKNVPGKKVPGKYVPGKKGPWWKVGKNGPKGTFVPLPYDPLLTFVDESRVCHFIPDFVTLHLNCFSLFFHCEINIYNTSSQTKLLC